MIKGSLEAAEHWAFVIAMAVFSFMAFTDYSRDGDRISLVLAITMTVIAILATYFRSFYKWKDDEDG